MFDKVPTRVVLAVLAFFGFQNLYLMRFNFSVISVGMIKSELSPANSTSDDYKNSSHFEQYDNATSSSHWMHDNQQLEWSETVRGLFLGSFYYGYALTQIFGGRLAEHYGTKIIFGVAVIAPAFVVFFIPLGAKIHYSIAVSLRILQGLFQGMSWPSMHALLSKWIPPNERSRFIGIVYFASSLSFIFVLPLSGALMDRFSWETACYITGIIPFFWALFWFGLIHDTPSFHPRISVEEKNYINTATRQGGTHDGSKCNKLPLKSIFTSLPFIAIILMDIGCGWGMITFSTQLPRYVNEMHGHDFSQSGVFGGLPFVFRYSGAVISSFIADWLITKGKLSIGKSRKIFGAISTIGPAIIMVVFLYVDGNFATIICLQCFLLFLNGALSSGHMPNTIDICPNFSGSLFGISNTFYSITGFLAPVIIGVILGNEYYDNITKWNIIFWLCVPIYVIPGIFFIVFARGKVQSWNDYGTQDLSQEKININDI